MKMSVSNGTQITVEELNNALVLLQNSYIRIKEINNGTYNKFSEPIQFDYCTCPDLANLIDNVENLVNKISDVVYQQN